MCCSDECVFRYTTLPTTASQPVTEHIFFNVTDTGGNVLSWQPFMVTIVPDTYDGPLINIRDEMEVNDQIFILCV